MRDVDYKPQQPRHRAQAPESVLRETARYIADSWEQESPGCTAGDPPEEVARAIMEFMRCHGIQTVEDYEDAMTKDCGGVVPLSISRPPVKE